MLRKRRRGEVRAFVVVAVRILSIGAGCYLHIRGERKIRRFSWIVLFVLDFLSLVTSSVGPKRLERLVVEAT